MVSLSARIPSRSRRPRGARGCRERASPRPAQSADPELRHPRLVFPNPFLDLLRVQVADREGSADVRSALAVTRRVTLRKIMDRDSGGSADRGAP
jgi:hypothetical protein